MTFRPPSQGGFPPGTARAPSRGSSSYMYAPQAGVGVGLSTNVQVTMRPVTSQGMKGMGATSAVAGPGRQVMDRSFFLAKLREKCAELTAELERLKGQMDNMEKGQSGKMELDRKLRDLTTEVSGMKASLTTLNFAMEQVKTDKEIDHLKSHRTQLQRKNADLRDSLDLVFQERKQKELKVQEVQEKIRGLEAEVDQKFKDDDPMGDKASDYYRLREENKVLTVQLEPVVQELDQLSRQVADYTNKLKADTVKQVALQLQERKRVLKHKKDALLAEIAKSETGMLPDEQTRLLNQVKADTQEIELVQKRMEQKKNEIQAVKDSVSQLEVDLQDYKGDRAEKYRELEAKDKEMTEFIDKLESTRKEQLDMIAHTEETIVNLLEHISKNLLAKEQMPSKSKLQEMQADLKFKEQQMDYSKTTFERLKNELDLRKKELEKVNSLDSKITAELDAIRRKMKDHNEGIAKFSDIEALRAEYDQKRKDLQALKTRMLRMRDALKGQVYVLSSKTFEPMRQALTENETHTNLQAHEQRIRQQQQSVFALSEFIAQKGSEADYIPIKVECSKLVEQINNYIKEQHATRA